MHRLLFQWCMSSIFLDKIKRFLEVFMDDFSVFGYNFEKCLHQLELVPIRCKKKNLVLNWEKCNFMVKQGIVLGHVISEKGIEVDNAKVDLISNLSPPRTVKQIRSFLYHSSLRISVELLDHCAICLLKMFHLSLMNLFLKLLSNWKGNLPMP